ncbi:MAG: class I SAM-dependent methyltransferase [Oscillochloridaceae bacterium]|nr:class I SAM-dependent methyltransferase [Chloroflexaceae bacterium]MDW8391092.1 class I SAM-dependent methyltransferase [Oscillochloridaceae bacterium]
MDIDIQNCMDAKDYNDLWQVWDEMKRYGPMSRHIRRNILSLVRPLQFDTVLDVGCGQGSLLAEMRREFPRARLYGADFSTSAIRMARWQVPGGTYLVFDLERGNLNHQFDLVICSEVLEHIPDDRAALRHLAAMTGKYLVISTVQGRMRRFETKAVGHVRNYAYGELVGKVEATGLQVRKVVEWGFPFYSPLYRDVLNLTGGRGTSGSFGPTRRLIANLIYVLFTLNSSRIGDEIFVLAERK